MPGPWEDYAPTATQTVGGPWEDYGKKPWEDYAPKKKTLEQIKASVGPSSESEVPLATKIGSALEPWVASLAPQNLWNQVERGASAVGNALAWPAYKLAGIPTEQRKPFVIDTQNNVLSQPAGTESTLPYKPGVPTLPAPLKDADVNPISEVINNFIQGASTPGGIATLPAFAAGGASSKIAQALLATQMIPGAAEQAQVALSPEATSHERAVAGMQALLSGLFGLGATKGVLEKPSALTVGKPVPDVTYPLPRIEDLSTQEQPASAVSALLPQFSGGPYPAENTKLVNAGGGVMDLTQLSPAERAALDQRTRQVYRLRGEEVGPRPAQAETPIIGQQPQQNIIRQVQLEQGGGVGPVSAVPSALKQVEGEFPPAGPMPYPKGLATQGELVTRESGVPSRLLAREQLAKQENASPIRSNQENLSQEGLQPTGSGGPRGENLQQHAEEGKPPSDTLQRQAPIEQRGPLGGNVSTFGLLDPAVYKRAGEDIVGVIKKLNNDRAAVADSLKRIGTKATIVAKHEAVDTGRYQAEHLAEQSFRLEASRLFQQFGDTAQKAVLVYKSAKGDKTLLPKFLAQAIKGGDKELARLVRFAGTNWDQIRRLSDKAEAMDKINLANAKQAGIDISTVGDYVKRIVENPNEGLIFKQRGIGGTGKSSKLARVYPTIFDGTEAGMRYNLDTAAAIGKRTGEIQMQINMKNWVEGNRSLVDPVEKQPVIKDLIKDKSGVMTAPRGYVEVQISKGNNVAVLQGYERVVKALQSEGLTGLGWQAALYGTGAIKHGSFAFDFYHQFKIIRARKSFGLSNPLTNPLGYKHGLALIDFEASDLAEAVKQKKAIGDATSYANEQLTFKRTGAKDLTYTRREIAKLFQDGGLRIGQHSEAIYSSLVRSLPLLKQTAGRSNRFIFDKLSRGAMEEAAQIEFERLMNASPDKPVAEIVQAIKTDLNFKFGNMGKQGIWKNKTMQDLSQLVFSAPSWTESLAQSEVRSVYQLGKAAIPGSGSFGTRGSLGRSNMNLTLFWVAATQILSLALNNKPTWENDNPEHKFDAYIPPLTKDGKGFYVSPLSDHMEILHDYIRYSNKDEENPTAKILSNKLSGPARFTHTMLTGDTWNNHLETIAERLNSAWPDLLPVPLPARMAYDAYKTKDLTPLERQGFSMLGVKAEPETRTEQIQKTSVDKTLEQRQAEATKRKDEQEPRTRQETVQSANYAVKAVAKRAEEMQARLPKDQQRWLADNKLVLPGHENKVHTDAADVVMTEKENKAFEALLLTGYKEMIKTLQEDPEFKKLATHSERVHVFGHYMSAARANATGEIIGQMDAVKAKK